AAGSATGGTSAMVSDANDTANDYATTAHALRSLLPELKSVEVRDELRVLADAYERLAAQVPKMAATWEPGTWSTVGMITFALNPMPPEDMSPGESYDSWMCQACGTPIALARRSPDASPYDMPDGVIGLKCPNCHAHRFYTIHDRRVRPYSIIKG